MVDHIYPTELQLNRANSSDTEAPFLDLNCISNGTVSTKIYDKRDDFDFDIIVNFPFLDGEVPRRTSYGVYISQIRINHSLFPAFFFTDKTKRLMGTH